LRRDGATFRGQPLVLLGLILTGWFAMRVALWQSPWESGDGVALATPHAGSAPASAEGAREDASPVQADEEDRDIAPSPSRPTDQPAQDWLRRPLPEPMPISPGWEQLPLMVPIAPPQAAVSGTVGAPNPSSRRRVSVGTAIGHNMLMMAGLQGELPDALIGALEWDSPFPSARPRRFARPALVEAAPGPAGVVPNRAVFGGSRWSADAWVLLRDDKDAPFLPGQGSYGRSQAGAVLRYRLAPGSGHAPQAHLRASVALSSPGDDKLRDSEVAAGVSARPIPSVPVRVAAEARVSDTSRGAKVRPAVYTVTELNPVRLPLGARGDVYLQGGYVGGDFATAFVDGQARVERPLGRTGPAEFFVGAAAWGGAQKGASRLDVGPSAGASVSVGQFRGRLTADYRFRVAGESRPASGPALTLYAGF